MSRIIKAVFIFLVFLNCINPFAPELGEVGRTANIILTDQKSPDGLLQNFKYAYVFKDSLIYRDLLDDSFQFIYLDTEKNIWDGWDKEKDIKTTSGLFGYFTNIDLQWNSTNYIEFTSDSAEVELSKSFILILDNEIRIIGDALFKFIREKETGIWLIKQWIDKSIT